MALARSPWERNTTGSSIKPCEISLANSPRRPEVDKRLTTPLRICSIKGLCTSCKLEAAMCRFLKPISASLATTMLTTLSPPRKWWWKDIVIPSFKPLWRIASSSVTTFEQVFWYSKRGVPTFLRSSTNVFLPILAAAASIIAALSFILFIVNPP